MDEEKRQIEIVTNQGRKRVWATAIGPVAWHPSEDDPREYVVTNVATGKALPGSPETEEDARLLARYYAERADVLSEFRARGLSSLTWDERGALSTAFSAAFGEDPMREAREAERGRAKKTMGVWTERGILGGKYLVIRRDGTVVDFPHFTLGARDAAAPAALRAYADAAESLGYDPDMVLDMRKIANDFERYRAARGAGDADARPHRKDDPEVVRLMVEGGRVQTRRLSPRQGEGLARVLRRIASWTAARWDSHLRWEIGDEDADAVIRWLHAEVGSDLALPPDVLRRALRDQASQVPNVDDRRTLRASREEMGLLFDAVGEEMSRIKRSHEGDASERWGTLSRLRSRIKRSLCEGVGRETEPAPPADVRCDVCGAVIPDDAECRVAERDLFLQTSISREVRRTCSAWCERILLFGWVGRIEIEVSTAEARDSSSILKRALAIAAVPPRDPLDVHCPTCFVDPGEPCQGASQPHAAHRVDVMMPRRAATRSSRVLAAAGLVTGYAGIVLVLHRERGWELPGGHVEEDESAAEAAVRAVREEAGLCATLASAPPSLLEGWSPGVPRRRVVAIVFSLRAKEAPGSLRPADPDGLVAEARWFRPRDVPLGELSRVLSADVVRRWVSGPEEIS